MNIKRRLPKLFQYLLGAAVLISQCFAINTAMAAEASKTAQVNISDFEYSPATVTIPVGGTVTWTNHDTASHTVTSNDKIIQSNTLAPGASYSHTFTKIGTYNYFCSIHPTMKGEIIVQKAS